MSDNPLIAKAMEQIAHHDREALKLKQWVNGADVLEGKEPRFGDLAADGTATAVGAVIAARQNGKKWQPGEFLGKAFSAAVRSVLLARGDAAGGPAPASVDDIHEALTQGTFEFGAAGAEPQKQSIRISLGKNSAVFVKLPNTDLFGLVEWYPGLKRSKTRLRLNGDADQPASPGDEVAGDEEAAEQPAAPFNRRI